MYVCMYVCMVYPKHYCDAQVRTLTMILATYLGQKKKIFLAVDDEPVSKIDICLSAVASKLFPDAKVPQVIVASIAKVVEMLFAK